MRTALIHVFHMRAVKLGKFHQAHLILKRIFTALGLHFVRIAEMQLLELAKSFLFDVNPLQISNRRYCLFCQILWILVSQFGRLG